MVSLEALERALGREGAEAQRANRLEAALQETVDALHWWHIRTMVRDNLTPLEGSKCDNPTCIRAREALRFALRQSAQEGK